MSHHTPLRRTHRFGLLALALAALATTARADDHGPRLPLPPAYLQ